MKDDQLIEHKILFWKLMYGKPILKCATEVIDTKLVKREGTKSFCVFVTHAVMQRIATLTIKREWLLKCMHQRGYCAISF